MACGMCGTLWLTMVRLLAHSLGILRLQLCPTMWPCGLAMGWPGLPLPGMCTTPSGNQLNLLLQLVESQNKNWLFKVLKLAHEFN